VLVGEEEFTADAGWWVASRAAFPTPSGIRDPTTHARSRSITPAGFERFFRELSAIFSADGPPDVERLTTRAADYHHHFRPDLEQR
jgi:hypothetical protein